MDDLSLQLLDAQINLADLRTALDLCDDDNERVRLHAAYQRQQSVIYDLLEQLQVDRTLQKWGWL